MHVFFPRQMKRCEPLTTKIFRVRVKKWGAGQAVRPCSQRFKNDFMKYCTLRNFRGWKKGQAACFLHGPRSSTGRAEAAGAPRNRRGSSSPKQGKRGELWREQSHVRATQRQTSDAAPRNATWTFQATDRMPEVTSTSTGDNRSCGQDSRSQETGLRAKPSPPRSCK